MSFDELSAYFERLEAAAGRLDMRRLLGELFYKANSDEVAVIAYPCEARLITLIWKWKEISNES